MLRFLRRLIPWTRSRRPIRNLLGRRRVRPIFEGLEDRTVPSTIVWNNRGSILDDRDHFHEVFGTQAEQARAVVDAAVKAWQNVIADFNYSDGSNTFYLDVTMSMPEQGNGGYSFFPSQYDSAGKPMRGAIFIESGKDGKGDGYFIDPTPTASEEFRGTIVNAFAGNATPGSAAVGKSDFFTIVAHEMSHALGLTGDGRSAFQQNVNGYLKQTGQTDKYFKSGKLYTFDGPSVRALFTSYNRFSTGGDFGAPLHTAEPANTFTNASGVAFAGSEDMNNAIYEYGRRYLPSLVDALVLHDVYGYTITPPQSFGTFYADHNELARDILVRGGAGTSNDVITIQRSTDQVVVAVELGTQPVGNGTTAPLVSSFPVNSVRSILVQSGGGNDVLNVEASFAGVVLTLDAGDGTDTINLGSPATGLAALLGPVNLTGGTGSDTLNLNDQANTANSSLTVRDGTILRTGIGAISYAGVEKLFVHGGSGQDNFFVETLPRYTAVVLNGNGGNDTFRLGSPSNLMDNLIGTLTVNGGAGVDTIVLRDQGSTTGQNYGVTASTVTRSGLYAINFTSQENVIIYAGKGNDTLSMATAPTTMSVLFYGGAGVDTVKAGNVKNTWRITAKDVGTLNRTNAFSAVENLIGGTDADLFQFSDGATLSGGLDGNAGTDTLDFTSFTSGVEVNLTTNRSTPVAGAARNIENVNGGSGDDILTGNSQTNVLRGNRGNDQLYGMYGDDILIGGDGDDKLDGGAGRDVLLGGAGADKLQGGSGEDLLLAGATGYDLRDAELLALLAAWSRSDQEYHVRIDTIRKGKDLGTPGSSIVRLDLFTSPDDGAADLLTGGNDRDWFVANIRGPVRDTMADLSTLEEVN